jgi:hypothetical protein
MQRRGGDGECRGPDFPTTRWLEARAPEQEAIMWLLE